MPKGKFTPFTKAQEQYIKDHYLERPIKVLCGDLNCGFGRIERFLKKNDLHIPKEIVEKRKRKSQFQKGKAPANKGKKQSEYMSLEAIERSKRTRFKKGNEPHNTKSKNGTVSIRRDSSGNYYKYIRINKGVWRLYHRILWERKRGAIPDGKMVAFKDGNSLNVVLDNLELITKEENMYRNSKMNYPTQIIPSLVLINQLEKKLNDLDNG